MIKDDKTKLIEKINELNLSKKREEALELVNEILEKYPNTEDFLMWKAFLLFHIVISKKFNGSDSAKKLMLNEAINIYKKFLKHKDEKVRNNANFYLTQIMAIQGDKKSLRSAKQNYKRNPGALSANRLVDVCLRLGLFKKAQKFFKLYEKQSKKEKIPQIYVALDKAVFYKKIGNKASFEKYKQKGLELDVSDKSEVSAQELLRELQYIVSQ